MKIEKQKQARELRQQGYSIKQIEKIVGCARSSVSEWVRNIQLTDEQQKKLQKNISIGVMKSGKINKQRFLDVRIAAQEIGKQRAKTGDQLFIAGCMLYWGEGTKSRNLMAISNSDPEVLRFFLKFAKECFNVPQEKIRISIQCYNDKHSVEDIEEYWQKTLELPKSSFTKTILNHVSSYSKNKRCGICHYGTVQIRISGVQFIQQVYGGIQSFAGFDKPEWVM